MVDSIPNLPFGRSDVLVALQERENPIRTVAMLKKYLTAVTKQPQMAATYFQVIIIILELKIKIQLNTTSILISVSMLF